MGEFLPLLVVIVVGLISTFSKMKGQNQENQGKPMLPPQLDPMHPKHFEEKIPQKKKVPIQSTFKHEQKSMTVIQNETSVRTNERTNIAPNRVTQFVEKNVEEPIFTSKNLKNINKRNLIQGVIMAEVLGPPRALKPHRTNVTRKLPN